MITDGHSFLHLFFFFLPFFLLLLYRLSGRSFLSLTERRFLFALELLFFIVLFFFLFSHLPFRFLHPLYWCVLFLFSFLLFLLV